MNGASPIVWPTRPSRWASWAETHEGLAMEIIPQPLTRDAFAPFGDVIEVPNEPGRLYYEEALGNLRAAARPSLSVSLKVETRDRPLRAELLERHEFSSQTFL